MAALAHPPPPRTPSPKIKIHRSQSFDSPSSRISVTPIDESPYSKSANYIDILPRYNALRAAEHTSNQRRGVKLYTKISDDDMMSDASSFEDGSSASDDSASPTSEKDFGLFINVSPSPPPPPSPQQQQHHHPQRPTSPRAASNAHRYPYTFVHPRTPSSSHTHTQQSRIHSSPLSIYQDPSTPMYDPWLVRVVLDLFDIRGFDWMSIAEPIERAWGCRTSSAEVLGILVGNGRVVGWKWWD
ncbi:hypothetical protein K504DRAFT_457916 [Pleomassaria siparia CBS 279.74]|uniref:Uncharacterized protein n=1 Tax=Pleomassaria siparia CBS 279.74 TaxID=1314801 RepID=A0A6G1KTX7_9PLEO|nr:hypothetical protein K504DRAFT_457916 [Pleomassaria siparia CBS 279.74]